MLDDQEQTNHGAAQPGEPGEEKSRRRTTRRTASTEHAEHAEHSEHAEHAEHAEHTEHADRPDGQTLPPQEAPKGSMLNPQLGHEQEGAGEAGAAEHPVMQRAEELIDRAGDRISHFVGQARGEAAASAGASTVETGAEQAGERFGRFVSGLGVGVMRAGARAREELEDIWAEAQNVRHHDQGSRPE